MLTAEQKAAGWVEGDARALVYAPGPARRLTIEEWAIACFGDPEARDRWRLNLHMAEAARGQRIAAELGPTLAAALR